MRRPRFKYWGLSAQLVLTVAATVAVVLTAFAALTAFQLKHGAERQKEAVRALVKERFIAQLQVEAKLASSLLERSLHNVDAAAAELAGRTETHTVVQRGNIVSIDLLMQKVVNTGPLDAILVVDAKRSALGSHSPGLDLLAANSGIANSPLKAEIDRLLSDQNPDAPTSLRTYGAADTSFMRAMGMKVQSDALLLTSIHPVFDDFGDAVALVIGHRSLTGEDELLHHFAQAQGLAIEVRDNEKVLLRSGTGGSSKARKNEISYCDQFAIRWQFCVLTAQTQLSQQTSSLVWFIENERWSLTWWLLVAAVVSLLVATLVACIATRKVLAPLAQITRAVRSVAGGNWLAGVAGQRRRDEVGEIARAVVVLQRSVKEREKLQADFADVEQVRQQRMSMTASMEACRSVLRQRLFALSDKTERLEDGACKLIDLTAMAEGQVDETRLVTNRAFRSASFEMSVANNDQEESVLASFDRLNDTVGATAQSGREVVEELSALTQEVGGLDHVVKRFLGDLADVPTLPNGVSVDAVVSELS